jgi:uncharacterized protein (TIGR02466 family)|tara:strand:+ start:76 stop:774 length:699 start_codon:yes stop_codon:yes gene_type:complete
MSKIILEHIFPTALYTVQLGGMEKIHKDLIDYIYSLKGVSKQKHNKYKASSQGGWHSSFLDTDVPEVKTLCQELFPPLNPIVEGLGWDLENYKIKCDSIWSIINPKYAYNTSHVHKGSLLSVAYYLKVPKGGNAGSFVIKDPRSFATFFPPALLKKDKGGENITPQQPPETIGCTNGQSNAIEIEPKEGLMVIFPSWLEHKVTQNLSDSIDPDRIVISFNVSQEMKITPLKR